MIFLRGQWGIVMIAVDAIAIATNGGRGLSPDDDYSDYTPDDDTLDAEDVLWDDMNKRWEKIKELYKPDLTDYEMYI